MKEKWKTIDKYPDYEISNFGNVRLCETRKHLKLTIAKKGYVITSINNKLVSVHLLVLETFKGKKPFKKCCCNHKDGNKENNYYKNLEWCTYKENSRHAVKMGLMKNRKGMLGLNHSKKTKNKIGKANEGEKSGSSKLKNGEVWLIKKILKLDSLTVTYIAKMFKVCRTTISDIKFNRTWNHIKV